MARPSKELIGASTGLLVLGALAREPSYGYEIVKNINDAADGAFLWMEGTIYPVLHKLVKEGMIRAQWQAAENGRERKYYYITAKGRTSLSRDVTHWNTFHALVGRLAGGSSHG